MLAVLYIVVALAAATILFGIWLFYRGVGGKAVLKWKDDFHLDIPASLFIAVVGGAIIYLSFQAYAPGLERHLKDVQADNEDLRQQLSVAKADADATRKELSKTQDEREEARKKAAEAAASSQESNAKLQLETGKRREAEATAKGAWLAFNRYKLSDLQRAAFDRLSSDTEKLNDGLTHLRIALTPWPKLDGIDAVATFEIYRKDYEKDGVPDRGVGLFEFPEKLITLQDDYNGRLAEAIRTEIATSVCRAAQAALVQGIPLTEAIRQIPRVSGIDLNASSPIIGQLTEFAYVQMRLKMMAGQTLVLVRGYADGEEGAWSKPLGRTTRTMMVHANMDPRATDPEKDFTFRASTSPVELGRISGQNAIYGNADLPDLRAGAVADILTPIIDSCRRLGGIAADGKTGPTEVEVLDGHVYRRPNMPQDRKARVYAMAYLKE